MAIEAVASVAAKELVASQAATEATKQLAEKIATQSIETRALEQTQSLDQLNRMESFRLGEGTDSNEKLKFQEANAEEELKNKIGEIEQPFHLAADKVENSYTWNDAAIVNDAGDKVYCVKTGETSAYILNDELPANATIRVENPTGGNTITVTTDEYSRPVEYHIDTLQRANGIRDIYQQQRCRYIKDGLASDDASHIVAREFGGPFEQFNYLPMDSYTNRHGEWRNMEKDWGQTLDSDGTIKEICVQPLYGDVCKRPTGLDISYVENGEVKYRYIDNTPRPVDLVKSDNTVMYNWKTQGA